MDLHTPLLSKPPVAAAHSYQRRTPETRATGLKFFRAEPMRTEQVAVLLADVIKRVTLQAERFFARRADADGALKPGDPALAALLRGALFGPHELQRVEPTGKAGAPPFQTKSRNCIDSQGFNLHANTAVHELARDRLEHLIRYICRPAVAAKRIVASGPHHVIIQLKNEWRGGVTGVRLTSRDLTIRLLAQVPLPKVANVHYYGLFAPGAKQREEVVPARGGRVAHNKRKGKRKAGANVGAATDQFASKPTGDGAGMFKLVAEAAAAHGEVEKEYSTKLTWAACLRRAFFVDAVACPCGGRRQVIAVILRPSDVEKILRHVKLWRESGDKNDSDIIEIRGPPGDLVPAQDQPDDDWDGWDEPPPLDWAA